MEFQSKECFRSKSMLWNSAKLLQLPSFLSKHMLTRLFSTVFATIAPAYASEVLPLSLRVYLTSYTNMCFIIGQLIAAGVLDGLVHITSEWSYRIPFVSAPSSN
jgi:hypothetical protein